MSSAGDVINGALRLIGQLAEGETPSSETSQDGLTAMNQMIDSWSIERLSVFSTQDQVFSWPVNETTVTIGPTGDIVGNRPVTVDSATYFTYGNISYPIQQVNEAQYNSITLKEVSSTFPQVMWAENTFPDTTLHICPVPSQTVVFHLVSVNVLTQAANLATDLTFPPGYLRAFRFNLACELAAEFGVEPPPQVQRIAMASKRALKRINNPNDVLAMPWNLVNTRFNIYSGQP